MALKLALILQAVDRMTGPAKRARAGVAQLTRGARELARSSPAAARGLDRVSQIAGRMPTLLKNAAVRVKALAGRAGMKGLELAAKGAGTAIGTLIGKAARLGATLAGVAVAGGAFAAGATIGGVFTMGSMFEQLELRLAGVAGSTQAARAELRGLVAMKLAVPIEQLAEAYVTARKAGIAMSRDSLRALAGDAIASKKPIDELIASLADAKRGDFGGLDALKISASAKGGETIFTYLDKDGRRAVRRVRSDAAAIEKALTGIFAERSGGAMDGYERSFQGLMARLSNWWKGFQLRVADAGIFDRVKGAMERVTNWLDAKLADGSIDKWAKRVSDGLSEAFDWAEKFVKGTDWKAVGAEISDVATAAWTLAKWMAAIVNWAARLVSTRERMARNGSSTVVDGGGLFTIREVNDAPPPKRPQPKPRARAAPLGLRAPATPVPGLYRMSVPQQKVQAGGKIEISLSAAPGTQARVASVKQTGDIPLSVSQYRGPAMGRPA